MDKNLGYINVSFTEFLNHQASYEKDNHQYISLGFYHNQLIRYFNTFDKSKILVILSDDFFIKPKATVEKIFQFLGVDKNYTPNFDIKYNQYSEPRFNIFKQIKKSYLVNKTISKRERPMPKPPCGGVP